MPGPQRTLATVLFTDIVGSTARATELGDRGWRELLSRHDEVIRRLLRRWAGVEVNTAGDGFVARFSDPAYAIACAWAIREALHEIDLPIRAGLHMGQVEGAGRDAVGIAVHVGARVAAAAEQGEILVSRAVHDAVEGAGFVFEDRGVHDLKGVPGDRRLFRVTRVPAELLAEEAGWRERLSARMSRRIGIGAALALAAILVGLYVVTRARDPSSQLPEGATGAAPAVAVLPFTVQGADLDLWREGMVDVLSTNLDGAAGLRAIDSRTVLARWRETVPAGGTADLARALEIARRTGARYALLGSVVASGPNMRLVADLYDARSGKSLGQGQVEGAPDSIFGLVDRLSIEVLGAIFEQRAEGLPEIRLASVTTGSVPALKAFLEGETLLRQGDFDDAVDAYQRALVSDSTFALAAYRLSEAYGWSEGVGDLATHAIERAARLADRLPDREEALVRGLGSLALNRGTLDGIDILREVVRLHPDDAEGWYLIGDTYFHFCGMALLPPGESDRALARAIALDPRFAPAYVHQINAAFRFSPDSARVARLIDAYSRLAPGTGSQHRFQVVFALAFGDSSSRGRALAAIDTTSIYLPFMVHDNLSHARFLETKADVLKVALEDPDLFLPGFAAQTLFETLLFRGRLEEALAVSHHPAVARRGELLYEAHVRGFPVPEDELATELALAAADTADVFSLLYAGAFAAERGRWGDHAKALARLRSIVQEAGQVADSTQVRLAGGVALVLEGLEAWRRGGRLVEARRVLDQARTSVTGHFSEEIANRFIRWWLGEILIESGEPREAARYFRALASGDAFVTDPIAAYRLGQLYERLEEDRVARTEYEYFLSAWRDPDPSLRAWVEETRQAMTRLPGPR